MYHHVSHLNNIIEFQQSIVVFKCPKPRTQRTQLLLRPEMVGIPAIIPLNYRDLHDNLLPNTRPGKHTKND